MTEQMLTVDHSTWRCAPEVPRPFADNVQALLLADAMDEITLAPLDVAIQAATSETGLAARASASGRVGLVGRPLALFAPSIVAGATLSLTLTADGFLPLALSGTLGPQPNYPDNFSNLGTVSLHRSPTTIKGRTVAHDRTVRPASNVTISGIWTTRATLLSAPAPANVIAITPGLYADRPATAWVRQRNVSPALPQPKQLIQHYSAGASQIRLSDQLGLSPGGLLVVEWPDKDRSEIIAISAIIDPGSTADLPATVVLLQSLRRDHPNGATVFPATAGAPGAWNSFALAGQTGDVTLFPGTMTGLDLGTLAVEVSGGPATEYHWAEIYAAVSDSDGYFRLPPIHRLAQIQTARNE